MMAPPRGSADDYSSVDAGTTTRTVHVHSHGHLAPDPHHPDHHHHQECLVTTVVYSGYHPTTDGLDAVAARLPECARSLFADWTPVMHSMLTTRVAAKQFALAVEQQLPHVPAGERPALVALLAHPDGVHDDQLVLVLKGVRHRATSSAVAEVRRVVDMVLAFGYENGLLPLFGADGRERVAGVLRAHVAFARLRMASADRRRKDGDKGADTEKTYRLHNTSSSLLWQTTVAGLLVLHLSGLRPSTLDHKRRQRWWDASHHLCKLPLFRQGGAKMGVTSFRKNHHYAFGCRFFKEDTTEPCLTKDGLVVYKKSGAVKYKTREYFSLPGASFYVAQGKGFDFYLFLLTFFPSFLTTE